MSTRKPYSLRRAGLALLAMLVAACSAPNLDESMAGESPATIRARIVDHGGWGDRLATEQLDQVAEFISDFAGVDDPAAAATAPGLTVWTTNECGSCHALAAGGAEE